jgi:hypothetical protein
MVIYDGDLSRALFRPAENKAPLLVDPDGVKPGTIPHESFEAVAGRHSEVLDAANRRKTPVLFLVEKLLGVAVSEGLDHERGGQRRQQD